jgi:aminoglycoside phosphotransferase (APT) family kinase protein
MRPAWTTLPAAVRAAVEELLGWPVVEAVSQPGGYSPGAAVRVRGPQGERAFVKAASADVNALAPVMHRQEALLTPLLPESLGCARLIGTVDAPPWFALVLTEVDGRPPQQPWVDDELDAALEALRQLSEVPAPPGLPPAEQVLADDLDRWPLLLAEPELLPAWESRHAARLADLEGSWRSAVAGHRLLHVDVRADNLLIRPDGSAVLVDWPSAAAGDPVLDLLALAPSVALAGGPRPGALLTRVGRPADRQVRVIAAALLGLFRWRSLQPPPGGMPTVRRFQADQADVLSAWLQELTGWA